MFIKGYCVVDKVIKNANTYIELKDVLEGDVVELFVDTNLHNKRHIECYVRVRRFDNEQGVLVASTSFHFDQFCKRFVEQDVYDQLDQYGKNKVNFIIRSVDNLQ